MMRAVGWNHLFWIALIIALTVRLALAVGVQQVVSRTPGRLCLIAGDAEGYWELAGKIAAGEDYFLHSPPRYVLRMPGFPALLSLSRIVFGNHPSIARIMLALVGAVGCGLTYWLGRELVNHKVGVIACLYTALSPTMSLFSVLFLSETAFAATMVASLIATARLVRMTGNSRSSIISLIGQGCLVGILIGLATYMRPTWLLVGPGIAILFVLIGNVRLSCVDSKDQSPPALPFQQSIGTRILLGSVICLSLALTLFPWTYRNHRITGHWIPTTLWVGPSLYDGLNPTATGDSDMQFFDDDQLMLKMSEYDMDREYRRRAWAYAAEHPARVISLAVIKQMRYWSPAPNSPQFAGQGIRTIAWLAYLPLILFAVVSAWFARHDWWFLILTSAPILYFAALHLLFVGSLRYRLPAEYALVVLSAYGASRLFERSSSVPVH